MTAMVQPIPLRPADAAKPKPPLKLVPKLTAEEREFLPAIIELIETPFSPTLRLTSWALCGLISAAIIWASLAHIDMVAVAETGNRLSMSETNEDEWVCRRLSFAAVILCFVHILTVVGTAYQGPQGIDYFVVINYIVYLSPVLLPLLVRKSLVLVIICAVPIVSIFCARMYFVWQLYSLEVNSGGQKGDAALFATATVGLLSIGVVSLWLLAQAIYTISNLIRRSFEKVRR